MIYVNGDIYEGILKKGKEKDKGIMKYNNGEIYNGEWNNDKREGIGFLYLNNKDYELIQKRIEFYKNNCFEIFTLNINDNIYFGTFKDDKKEGKGFLFMKNPNNFFEDNTLFEGDFINNERNGYGNIYFKTGCKFKGYWKNDIFDESIDGVLELNQNSKIRKEILKKNEWIEIIKIKLFGNIKKVALSKCNIR